MVDVELVSIVIENYNNYDWFINLNLDICQMKYSIIRTINITSDPSVITAGTRYVLFNEKIYGVIKEEENIF